MSSAAQPASSKASSALLFLVLQVIFVGVLSAAVVYRANQWASHKQLPPLRQQALTVAPEYDYEVVVTDDQLRDSLRRLRPQLHGTETSIGHLDHHLRCWGAEATFDDDKFISGRGMRELLTDHRQFAALYGEQVPALLLDVDSQGVSVLEFEGSRSSPHVDHTLATLTEIGTPLDFPLLLPERETTFRAMVEQSLREFDLNQREYEWSTVTYALLVDAPGWVTPEGREFDFNMLAQRIMRQQMPQGVCMGNHRLHALVILLRVDTQTSILSPATREEILAYLGKQTRLLVAHQHSGGFWNSNWPTAKPATAEPTLEEGDRLGDRIIATGHALEWWSLAPQEVHPPRATLAAAGQWIVHTIEGMSEEDLEQNASFLSHAGRALALWRGKYPHEVSLSQE